MLSGLEAREGPATPPSRISQVVAPWAARCPDRLAIVDHDGAWSYGRLAEVMTGTARWLAGKGVRGGDRVVIVTENCRAAVALILAVAELDAWVVAVNARLSERELQEICGHCQPRLLILTASASPQARAHATRIGAVDEDVPGLGSVAVVEPDDRAEPSPVAHDPSDQVAALVYTSGSTGSPKAVMLTHRNLLFMARSSGAVRSLGPDDRFYGVLPVSHIVGLAVVVLGTLLYGATLQLCLRFNPAAALKALQQDRVTILLGAPAMFALLLEYAKAKRLATIEAPGLRLLGACGAPLDQAIKDDVERAFGLVLHNGYGITECSPTIAQTRVDQPQSDCNVGRVLPGVEIRLVGADGGVVAADGDVGELQVRGPNVMRGYYKDVAATRAAIDAEGWFRTGDLACMRHGHLSIVGRSKELIIRYGFNVYPAEVEAVLTAHPCVLQSAVIGHRTEGNEEILAFVQPTSGAAITPAELAEWAARQLAPYKRPSRIALMPSLPCGPTGKVLKTQLAELAETLAG